MRKKGNENLVESVFGKHNPEDVWNQDKACYSYEDLEMIEASLLYRFKNVCADYAQIDDKDSMYSLKDLISIIGSLIDKTNELMDNYNNN